MSKKNFLKITIFMLACANFAAAHPLGNFTINQYSRLEVERSNVKLHTVLDMAEIPTFQESQKIDANHDGTLSGEELNTYAERITLEYAANFFLSVNNQPVQFRPLSKKISLLPGAGNLQTLRIEWDLLGDLKNFQTNAVSRIHFENRNNRERIGWNEIVVSRTGDVKIFDSTAFGNGASEELKAYPQESLSAPLSERTADFSLTFNSLPPDARLLQNRDGQQTAPIQKDKFAELINVPEITFPIVLFGLALAFGLGAIHAMSPGHGKTVVGAYLVGSRGTIKHAVFLGATVTITHTLGVFALGLITLFASEFILPERIMPFLSFVSGLLVCFIGVSLFKARLFNALGWGGNVHHHGHIHDNEHFHEHDEFHNQEHSHDGLTHTHGGPVHTHLTPQEITWKSLLVLGISGGLLPCPSALVLMLSAISLNRIGYGFVLTLAFSFGLAATLTSIGLIFLYVGKAFGGSRLSENRVVKTLPVFSALVITCVGAVICYSSL